jgi:hypothetical protein
MNLLTSEQETTTCTKQEEAIAVESYCYSFAKMASSDQSDKFSSYLMCDYILLKFNVGDVF